MVMSHVFMLISHILMVISHVFVKHFKLELGNYPLSSMASDMNTVQKLIVWSILKRPNMLTKIQPF